MKNQGKLDNAKIFKSVETKNGTAARAKNGHKTNIADRKIRGEPKMSISEYLKVDGGFPHFLALPSDFQMKGQKMKLFTRQSVTVNKLYRSPSLDSSGTDQSGYSDQLYEISSSTRNDKYQVARSSYYPDKFHVLKEQLQILHQVINNRGKRIDSLNDVINSLHEQRQQLENGGT